MDRQLRWGIMGAGAICSDFVEAIALLPPDEHKVVAVAASSIERAHLFLEKHRLAFETIAYGSYQQLIDDPNVDLIYIGLRNNQHCEWVIKALDGGKNVICEKPMGLNVDEVKEMVAKARERKRFLQEAFWSRYFPVYNHIRKELQSKTIGDVRLVQGNFGIPLMHNERISQLEHGGGITLDIGCYMVQFVLFAFGIDAKIENIHVTGQKLASGVDAAVSVTICFEGNRMAQILYTGEVALNNFAIISGTKGRLLIPDTFNSPETLIKQGIDGQPNSRDETFSYPRPKCDLSRFNYGTTNGLAYEAAAVREQILAGRLESIEIPLNDSIKIAAILTEIRRQLGVVYPSENLREIKNIELTDAGNVAKNIDWANTMNGINI